MYPKETTKQANLQVCALSCGCDVDEALMDFFWFKQWRARSWNPRIMAVESLGTDVLHPRQRTFIVQAFMKMTGLTCEELYSNSPDTALKLATRALHHLNSVQDGGDQYIIATTSQIDSAIQSAVQSALGDN
jgi:hypothetical protein